MRSAGRQASNLEHGVTGQNIRSRAPWTTILASRQDVPNGGSLRGRAKTQVALRDGLPSTSVPGWHSSRLPTDYVGMADVSRR